MQRSCSLNNATKVTITKQNKAKRKRRSVEYRGNENKIEFHKVETNFVHKAESSYKIHKIERLP